MADIHQLRVQPSGERFAKWGDSDFRLAHLYMTTKDGKHGVCGVLKNVLHVENLQ
jgi:hypothetical protein